MAATPPMPHAGGGGTMAFLRKAVPATSSRHKLQNYEVALDRSMQAAAVLLLLTVVIIDSN
jgi:hypothetical protein